MSILPQIGLFLDSKACPKVVREVSDLDSCRNIENRDLKGAACHVIAANYSDSPDTIFIEPNQIIPITPQLLVPSVHVPGVAMVGHHKPQWDVVLEPLAVEPAHGCSDL